MPICAAAASIGSRRALERNVSPPAVDQPNARAARRAGVRLGVEAAVARILVLRPALRRTSRTTAMVVSGRSYGTPRTIVNRGPQLVQLMNG